MNEILTERKRLRSQMLTVIRSIHRRGWSEATSTNYSFRNPVEEGERYTISISRSGVDKEHFEETDFIEVDAQGEPTPDYAGIRPSAETGLHTMIYAEYPRARAILHTHSVFATILSRGMARSKGLHLEGYEMLKALPGVDSHEAKVFLPMFANSQDIAGLSGKVREALRKNPDTSGFLLVGHGLYAWGNSVAAAKRHLEAYEFLIECKYRWKQLGLS